MKQKEDINLNKLFKNKFKSTFASSFFSKDVFTDVRIDCSEIEMLGLLVKFFKKNNIKLDPYDFIDMIIEEEFIVRNASMPEELHECVKDSLGNCNICKKYWEKVDNAKKEIIRGDGERGRKKDE
jgi:hypothetical protein